MKINRPLSALLGSAALALVLVSVTSTAQAQDVYWSLGMSSPGVQLGMSNAPPMMVQPMYPVIRQPQPVYVMPAPVVYVQGPPVYRVQPPYAQVGWQQPVYGWGRRHGHGRHEGERFEQGRQEHRRD